MLNSKQLRALMAALLIAGAPLYALVPQAAFAQTAAPAAPDATAAPAPVAAPADAAPMAAGDATHETVGNPYGLEALWKSGDFIARFVLVLLVIMSFGSWYIMVTKVVEQMKLFAQAKAANKSFWTAGSVQQGASQLKEGSPFRYIAESGLQATERHEGLRGQIALNDWVTDSISRSVDNVGSRMQDGLAFLATVASTAPFVGLFGTVWGIYNALTAIGIAGQASIDKVAGPVGEALIMTAIGLAVAVPAVFGYNLLVRRNKNGMEQVRAFASDLHSVLMGAGAAHKG